jgi:hypothetical protein
MATPNAETSYDLPAGHLKPLVVNELIHSIKHPRLYFGLMFNLVGAIFVIAFSIWYRKHRWFHKEFALVASLLTVKVPFLYTGFFLVAWLLADLTVTNQIGSDPLRVLQLLKKGHSLKDILLLRNRLIAIIGSVVAIGGEIYGVKHTHLTHHYVSLFLLSASPIGIWLAAGNITSTLLVCKQMPLKQRIKNKTHLLRWIFSSSIPYVMGFLIFPIGGFPIVVANTINHLPIERITLFGVILLTFWSLWLWWLGYEIANIIISKRHDVIIQAISN